MINKNLQEIKEFVDSEKITILDLLKYSYKLIKMDILKLIAIIVFLQIIYVTNNLFMEFIQNEGFPLAHLLLSSLRSLMIGPLVFLLPVVALFEVYDEGQFSLKGVLTTTFKKFLKLLWTIVLPGIVMFLLFFCFAFLYGIISVFFEIPVTLVYLSFFVLLIIIFIWVFVPFYFLEYVVVATKYYGLAAINISFRLVKGRESQLFGYIVVTLLISMVFAVPYFIMMQKSVIIAYFYLIPFSVIGLYWWSYGLLLYKHVIGKADETNFDFLLNDNKEHKNKLCKDCLAKVDIEIKVCPHCGSEIFYKKT